MESIISSLEDLVLKHPRLSYKIEAVGSVRKIYVHQGFALVTYIILNCKESKNKIAECSDKIKAIGEKWIAKN